MLAACAHSPVASPAKAVDPIVETRTVVKIVCPAEISAPSPAIIAAIDDAITASKEALGWIAAHFLREAALDARLTDARAECARAAGK